jgi:signal transduction histidine kinase/signal recognition particle receptor subunit beta
MGFINLAERTISAKLVYYGVGMGGKTTSLQAVHGIMCPRDEIQLVSINTDDDSTLLFDFLPLDLGEVEGFKIRIQGFTVPGQPKYKRMRRYVLQGADAVVLVVDSQTSRLEENLQALDSLHENLRSNRLDPDTIPVVLQYNKRDLEDILPERDLDAHLKWRDGLTSFPSIAHEGPGVFETFVHAAGLIVESKVRLYGLGKGSVDPAVVAASARERLWELHDQHRGVGSDGSRRGQVEVTVPRDQPDSVEPEDLGDGGEVLTDEELDQELFAAPPQEDSQAPADDAAEQLLEQVIQTNVELAKHFGELDQFKNLLERKNTELVQVAQNTVHDLNRPLSVIKLMVSSMQRGLFGELPDKAKDALDNGMLAISQMERLIHELLVSSRLDYDGVQMKFEDIDLTLLVAQVLRTLRFEIEDRDAVCQVEPLPVVCADEWALTKALTNLIGNALQYAHPERRPRIRVYVESEEDRHVVVVADNGIGVPEADLPRLFRRFERGSNTSGVSGTGLGLHIVREVALGHGGQVWVESREGEGCAFRLALPHQPVMPPHSTVSDVAAPA